MGPAGMCKIFHDIYGFYGEKMGEDGEWLGAGLEGRMSIQELEDTQPNLTKLVVPLAMIPCMPHSGYV